VQDGLDARVSGYDSNWSQLEIDERSTAEKPTPISGKVEQSETTQCAGDHKTRTIFDSYAYVRHWAGVIVEWHKVVHSAKY
jgi:hypothetical protein